MWVDIDDDGHHAAGSSALLALLADDVASAVDPSWAGIVAADASSPVGASPLVRCADGRSVHLELVELRRIAPRFRRAWLRIRDEDEGSGSLVTVLSEWRAAGRRVGELSRDDSARVPALAEEQRLREAYQRAAAKARDHMSATESGSMNGISSRPGPDFG